MSFGNLHLQCEHVSPEMNPKAGGQMSELKSSAGLIMQKKSIYSCALERCVLLCSIVSAQVVFGEP